MNNSGILPIFVCSVNKKAMEQRNPFSIDALRERVLRLDGAMGTQIQSFHLGEEDFRKGLKSNGIELRPDTTGEE